MTVQNQGMGSTHQFVANGAATMANIFTSDPYTPIRTCQVSVIYLSEQSWSDAQQEAAWEYKAWLARGLFINQGLLQSKISSVMLEERWLLCTCHSSGHMHPVKPSSLLLIFGICMQGYVYRVDNVLLPTSTITALSSSAAPAPSSAAAGK